jgi:hypothetical protein
MLGAFRRRTAPSTELEQRYGAGFDAYQHLFRFNGNQYLSNGKYKGYQTRYLMSSDGPVSAVLDRRASIMGEARPAFQRFEKGKPGELYSTRELEVLKHPWPGGTFRQLVAICESDVAATGNSYWVRIDDRLIRVDPDYVTIVTADVVVDGVEIGRELVGYLITPPNSRRDPLPMEATRIAHYRPGAPVDEPFRGESWLAAVCQDASSDIELTAYKGNYLKNGAMPSLAVTYEPTLAQEQLEAFVPVFADKFTGAMNAGKILHFLGGRDVKTVGATLDQLAFKAVQGAGETRIAAAAGVPATVAGFSEGMQGSSLNAGNYGASRRLFGDAKIRPNLGSLMEAFETLIPTPADSRLFYDDSGVSFFQEDVTDEAEIRATKASTIRQLIEAGYEPDAVVVAVTTGRYESLVGRHSGLTSVQLTPPGTGTAPVASIEGENDDEPQE